MTIRKALEAPAKLDAYTGMLTASLGAMALAAILLFIDYSSYPTDRPVEPSAPETLKTRPAQQTPNPTPTTQKG